ncbi:hypothetical protein DH2020_021964 [Rehmannia glutinosa]|uniref:Reticulon-like protein n=1 Tax=Rehmannia glutinosa TaxID=99300 RepID=A0ABR0WGE9_REHGL
MSSPSSLGSDSEAKKSTSPYSINAKVYRLFGWEKPIHKFLKISAAALGGVTVVWVLFELLEYHLLALVYHISILALSLLFLWSNVTTFINKRPPHILEVCLPTDPFIEVALALHVEVNRALLVEGNCI